MAFNKRVLLLATSMMGPWVLAHPAWAASGGTASSIGSETLGQSKVPYQGGPVNITKLGVASSASAKLDGSEDMKANSRTGSELGILGKEKGSTAGTPRRVDYMSGAIKTKPHRLPQAGWGSHNLSVFQGSPVRAMIPPSGMDHLRLVYHEKANETLGVTVLTRGSANAVAAMGHNLLAALRGRRDVYVTIQSTMSGQFQLTLHQTGSNHDVLGRVMMPPTLMAATLSQFVASGIVPVQCVEQGSGAVVLRSAIRARGAASVETIHRALKALESRHPVKTLNDQAPSHPGSAGGGSGPSIKPGQIIPGATTVHTGLPFGAELAVAGGLVAFGSGILVRSRRSG